MREVVESDRFRRERAALQPDVARWDQVFRGVEWALSNAPDKVGQPTEHPDIRALPTVTWPNAPGLVVYYRFDARRVVLLSVRWSEVNENGG